VPELPEVEIIARRLGAALGGAVIESALSVGVGTLKTFDPPLGALEGRTIASVRRRGKHLIINLDGGLAMLIHLMSAGRLQLFDKRGSLRDRSSRVLVRLMDGRELRLREFGTRHSCWVKVLRAASLDEEPSLAGLGPEAWPEPPLLRPLLSQPRPLHGMLRDQKVVAGIGRSWADEILHTARLSPFKRGDTLTDEEAESLGTAMTGRLGAAIEHYEKVIGPSLPDKFPMPLTVHGRQGEACPRCDGRLEAVYFEEHTISYCPACQTGGRLLKDRRLSRLLK
jgi:formamidopyrimidine-DNA glycosylase